ncbi:MAG TPA: hypothetical protein VG992_03740 [Candidatus Saccharimonadales bacterium]|nr:hypothetical protein [Candidatus Saccharimonadales bacterium]
MTEVYAVIPDSHGEYDKVARVIDATQNSISTYIFEGDIFGGPQPARLVGLIRDLGERAVSIAGNREWVCRNALNDSNDSSLEVWREDVWPGYERGHRGILDSYGVEKSPNWQENAANLREVMTRNGDLAWLSSLAPYFETDEFVAVHAGPVLDKPWVVQATYLDSINTPNGRLEDEPPQIFSHALAAVHDIPASVDNRTFITGHSHFHLPIEQRTAERKICLASNIHNDDPLFVWRSDSGRIHSY